MRDVNYDSETGILTFTTNMGDVYSIAEAGSGALNLLGAAPHDDVPRGVVVCASSDIFFWPLSYGQIDQALENALVKRWADNLPNIPTEQPKRKGN